MSSPEQLLSPEQANALYDVVVAIAGAPENLREQWLHYATAEGSHFGGLEFRFQGKLGFGGKLVYDGFRAAYVNCYEEHRSPAKDAIMAATNIALAKVPHSHRP
jgi:hypothetical protein